MSIMAAPTGGDMSTRGKKDLSLWTVDTAGGWAREAIETIHHCASRIDVSRRGHLIGIWWQLLSVALRREHERVLRWKVGA